MIKYLTDWKMWTMILAGISFFYSIFNHIIRNRVRANLTNNDLKYLKKDVSELKNITIKELKINLRKDLERIFRRLGRMEKNQGVQRAICDERHSKIK